jgi:uncharacterized membrane protein YbhN (UPF0104 family)
MPDIIHALNQIEGRAMDREELWGRFTAIVLFFFLLIALCLIVILFMQFRKYDGSSPSLILMLILIISIITVSNYALKIAVRFSGHEGRADVIAPWDRELLENAIKSENVNAVDLYIKLSTLRSPTGIATQLGLSGLPLLTIGMTIFFSIISLYESGFLDLAKLTLGAFIGSFVQRSGEAIERAVGAKAPATNVPAGAASISPGQVAQP